MSQLKLYLFLMMFLSLFSIIHSQDCQFGCQEPSEWETDFENQFLNNPQEGFAYSPEGAWQIIERDFENLFRSEGGDAFIEQAFLNNPTRFTALVNANLDLLNIPKVRELLEQRIAGDISVLNSNPQLRDQFFQEYGIQASGEFEVTSFSTENRILNLQTQSGPISISIDDLNGGIINSDGSIVLNNGVQVLSGDVTLNQFGYRFEGDSRINVHSEEIYSQQGFQIREVGDGGIKILSTEDGFVQYDNGLRQFEGSNTFYSNGNTILGAQSQIEVFDNSQTLLRRFSTDSTPMLFSTSQCSLGTNCVYEDRNNIQISMPNNGANFEVEVFSNTPTQINVEPILGDSEVTVKKYGSDGSTFSEFEISQDGMVQSSITAPLEEDDSFELIYRTVDEENQEFLTHVLRSNLQGAQSLMYTSEDFDLFEPNERCVVNQQCRIGRYNYVRNEHGVYCSNDGKCYNNHGIRVSQDGLSYVTGSSDDPEVISLISDFQGELDELEVSSQKGDNGVFLDGITSQGVVRGAVYRQISEVTGWGPSSCQVTGEFDCFVGSGDGNSGSYYRRTEHGTYCSRDGLCYNENGNRVSEDGTQTFDGEESIYKSRGYWLQPNQELNEVNLRVEEDTWAPSQCQLNSGYTCQIGRYSYEPVDIGGVRYFRARDGNLYDVNGNEFTFRGDDLVPTGSASSQVDYFQGGSQAQVTTASQGYINTNGEVYSGRFSEETQLLYRALHAAEWRGQVDYDNNWRRTSGCGSNPASCPVSSAYGPVQITRNLARLYVNQYPQVFTQEERDWITNTYIPMTSQMINRNVGGTYGYGGSGTLTSEYDRQMYERMALGMIETHISNARGDLMQAASVWRYGDGRGLRGGYRREVSAVING